MSADLFTASATDVLRRFRSRELSPVEYLGALIARIEAVGADVNALGDTYFEEALEQARPAEEIYMSSNRRPAPAGGPPARDQGRVRDRRQAHDERLADLAGLRQLRERPDRRARARRRCGRPRPDADARVLDRLLDAHEAMGRDAESLEPRVRRRWLERWLGSCARCRLHAARDRVGHRRLGAGSRLVLRGRRLHRAVRPLPRRGALQPRSLVQHGPACPQRRATARCSRTSSRACIRAIT